MPDKGWSRTFDDPIPLPGGSELHTLRDAGNYISRLPNREHDTFAWRAAIETLMLVAEHGGDTVLFQSFCAGTSVNIRSFGEVGPWQYCYHGPTFQVSANRHERPALAG
jgi:hypothetical protein